MSGRSSRRYHGETSLSPHSMDDTALDRAVFSEKNTIVQDGVP